MPTISRRSAKGIPKTAAKPDTSGTPPTDETSEITSGATEWTVEMADKTRKRVVVLGGNGRVSVGYNPRDHGGLPNGSVRFYRNQSIKGYDAYITGVRNVWSHNVFVEDLGLSAEVAKTIDAMAETKAEMKKAREKERFDTVLSRVMEAAGYGEPLPTGWADEGVEDDENPEEGPTFEEEDAKSPA